MKIRDLLKDSNPHISFEVFPPKTDAAYESVMKATEEIAALKPSFVSVTYGAGGGTSKNTVKIASHLSNDLGGHQSGASYLCIVYKGRSTSGD